MLNDVLKHFSPVGEGRDGIEMVSLMMGWDFKPLGRSSSGDGIAISPCGGYIVKHHYMTTSTETPECAIPTLTLKTGQRNRGFVFSLQPRVNVSEKAQRRALKALRKKNVLLFDAKAENCGYQGLRPVVIDW